MRLALVQSSMSKDVNENFNQGINAIISAANNAANLVCFAELQFSPFFPQHPGTDAAKYTIEMKGDEVQKIRAVCAEYGVMAVPNFYLQEADKRYDASPLIDLDGKVLGVSKMVHIAQAENFYEQDYYTQSDSGFHVYDTSAGKVGVVICFDRHFPESIRACALQGAQVIIIPTANTKTEPMEMFEWEMRIAAMHNGVFIAMCNRVGIEDKMEFSGESIVVDPNGDVVVKADDQETILYADIDLTMVKKVQSKRQYLNLRRPEAY